MRKIILFVLITMMGCWSVAAPMRYVAVRVVQPQGDTLRCFVSGDEFYNWLHDAEGYTIVQHPQTGQYVYAAPATAGEAAEWSLSGLPEGLRATSVLPGRDDPAKAGLKPHLMPTRRWLQARHKAWEVPEHLEAHPGLQQSLKSGEGAKTDPLHLINNVVIFIRFADEDSCTAIPFDTIDGMFNDSSATSVSMFNYFYHSSYRSLRVITQYLPAPAGQTVLSYQDSHVRDYFKPYNAATNPLGYNGDTERRNREFTLLQNAVNWVNANCPVSSLTNLDVDNDGLVDNVCFVVSGTYTGWSDLLWPHKWSIYDRTVNLGSKRVYTYNFQLAGSGQSYFNVSTLCHEMTHTLGAPDLYHYDNFDNVSPGGAWDLMNNNRTPPQQTNSLFKLNYTHWLDSIPLIEDSGEYSLQSLASGPNHAVRIASADPHQWYILEYRNWSDTFDSSIPNRGLLIWRYNDLPEADNASFDFDTVPHSLWLFRPGSSIDTVNGIVAQAAFGVGGRTAFNAWSDPHPYLCDGSPDSSFSITNIHITDSSHSTVTFVFNPYSEGSCNVIASYPHSQDFESGGEGCWTAVSPTDDNRGRMGVVGTASSVIPHSGSYQFRFSSYNSSDNYNQYLISPRLQHSHPLQLSFWYRRSNSSTETLRVLSSTTTRNPSAFTDTLADITVATSGWQQAVVTVPPEARHIALNYYSNYHYYLFVDDLLLRDTMPADTMMRDTVYILVHDTLTRTLTDTLTLWVHDTLTLTHHDTVFSHLSDTLFYAVIDTVLVPIYDTTPYSPELHEVAVLPNETRRGLTSGSGVFLEGTELEIAAIPLPGYRFANWMDGNDDNPRTITVSSDLFYSAHFLPTGQQSKAIVHITDTVMQHDTVWLTQRDTLWLTLHDTLWLHHSDTVSITLRDTLWLPSPIHDTLAIGVHEPYMHDTTTYFPLTVASADPATGIAAGNGFFPVGTDVQVGAIAATGYQFIRWSDGATENPHTVHFVGPTSIVATFTLAQPEGIENPSATRCTRIYTHAGQIVAEAPANMDVAIYNMLGQLIMLQHATTSDAMHRTVSTTLRPGVYVVRIGSLPASKITVLER